jgi:hypothetical protein
VQKCAAATASQCMQRVQAAAGERRPVTLRARHEMQHIHGLTYAEHFAAHAEPEHMPHKCVEQATCSTHRITTA